MRITLIIEEEPTGVVSQCGRSLKYWILDRTNLWRPHQWWYGAVGELRHFMKDFTFLQG